MTPFNDPVTMTRRAEVTVDAVTVKTASRLFARTVALLGTWRAGSLLTSDTAVFFVGYESRYSAPWNVPSALRNMSTSARYGDAGLTTLSDAVADVPARSPVIETAEVPPFGLIFVCTVNV